MRVYVLTPRPGPRMEGQHAVCAGPARGPPSTVCVLAELLPAHGSRKMLLKLPFLLLIGSVHLVVLVPRETSFPAQTRAGEGLSCLTQRSPRGVLL